MAWFSMVTLGVPMSFVNPQLNTLNKAILASKSNTVQSGFSSAPIVDINKINQQNTQAMVYLKNNFNQAVNYASASYAVTSPISKSKINPFNIDITQFRYMDYGGSKTIAQQQQQDVSKQIPTAGNILQQFFGALGQGAGGFAGGVAEGASQGAGDLSKSLLSSIPIYVWIIGGLVLVGIYKK